MKKSCSDISILFKENYFNIYLGKQVLKSKENNFFNFTNKNLAILLKNDIKEFGKNIDLNKILYFEIFSLAIDKIQNDKKNYIKEICNYASTDLICYRAESPEDLIKLQNDFWDPVLNDLGEINLKFNKFYGLMPKYQPKMSILNLQKRLNKLNHFELSCIFKITKISTSILLSYSLYKNLIDERYFFKCAFLDEIWQSIQWGKINDEEIKRDAYLKIIKKTKIILDILSYEK